MSKKVYVGNLSFNATEDGIRELFAEYGEVESVAWITDRDTGRFRGFCFVEMDDDGADSAISALDGQEIDGRNLKVNEARPREERSGGGGGRRGGGGGFNRGGGNRGGGGGGFNRGGDNRGGGNRGGGNRFPDSGGGSRW
ncbi:MAG: RNA-binding protein [Ardenticatenaceae bacterium]|nr:RNA-binding protein [Ardenticatenaceae bacterium]